MIEVGSPAPLGTQLQEGGVNFAIWSGAAERVELCLFDDSGNERARYDLPACSDGIWHGFLPDCAAGQRYGYRMHGRYEPDNGLRFNPRKLLIDPYARELSGEFRWVPEVFDFVRDGTDMRANAADSAPFVPKCVVVADLLPAPARPRVPWSDCIVYEANVRGYTMRHPQVPKADRGTFRGMRNGEILDYLSALGVTTIELLPVHAFIDEAQLVSRGLRNYWGYNTLAFFAPAGRYAAGASARDEFREMVDAIHAAGLEVLLDVVYNHTAETDRYGPTLCFRGIDNLAYYRTRPDEPGSYLDDTGCGNTINADHPRVRELIVDSLRYWCRTMGVDGFRFDLATVLGRSVHGFAAEHPLLVSIGNAPDLRHCKLIAEPWDVGPNGYQLGNFPPPWSEWNDRFRDSVRRFWRGDRSEAAELARRVHGSSDLFERSGRTAFASLNFVAAHDGFTLADVVSFEHKHNTANGEDNRDGHAHNFSRNYGVEGATADPVILAERRRQRLNMLATLLLSQGTPMLLAGDEFGNSQGGNNNAYAQDNETGWLDWTGLKADAQFVGQVRQLLELRQRYPLFRQGRFLHGDEEISWWHPDGRRMHAQDWADCSAFGMVLPAVAKAAGNGAAAVAVLLNASSGPVPYLLPEDTDNCPWHFEFSTASEARLDSVDDAKRIFMPARSVVVCVRAAKPR